MTAPPVEHGEEARAALREVVGEFGLDVLSRSATMASLVADLLPDAPRLAKLLVMAAECDVANGLREHLAQGVDPVTAAGLVASSLAARTMITPELCGWVVGEFGIVMGLIPDGGSPAYPPAPVTTPAPPPPPPTAPLPPSAAPPNAGGPVWQGGPAQGWQGDPAQAWPGAPTIAAGIPAAPVHPASPATYPGPTAPPGAARRKWAAAAVAGVVVLGVAGGLLIWAPWKTPPVLRPAGLTSGVSTVSSVAMTWSSPASGPLPDKYLILLGGKQIASAPGTVTTYQAQGLAPDTAYHFQVLAVRGSLRSPRSAILTTQTLTPPVSAAILSGSWTVRDRVVASTSGIAPAYAKGKKFTDSWTFAPGCEAGPVAGACSVVVSGAINGGAFSASLRRAGGTYTGTFGTTKLTNCGTSHTPIHTTVHLRVQISAAAPSGKLWAASSWFGTLHAANSYTSVGGGSFCSATSWTGSIGSP